MEASAVDGAEFFLSLPEDVLAVLSLHLTPRDLVSLALTSPRLLSPVLSSERPWFVQCLSFLPRPHVLQQWHAFSSLSFLHIARFLSLSSPLLGLWVHQNPELGNLVAVVPGFLSIVGLRILPQEYGGPLLWAPVFEILPDKVGHPHHLIIHGCNEDNSADAIYAGSVAHIDSLCNVLFLEIDRLTDSTDPCFDKMLFRDRTKLLECVVAMARVDTLPNFSEQLLIGDDFEALAQRRLRLNQLCNEHNGLIDRKEVEMRIVKKGNSDGDSGKKVLASVVTGYFKEGWRHLLWKSKFSRSEAFSGSSSQNDQHVSLEDFLGAAEVMRLSLRAARMRLTSYHGWPDMACNCFALYKLHVSVPEMGREYAGLWGGAFGWPPGRKTMEKPGKALFFLLLSYEEEIGQTFLIGTKILEGSHFVLHPNGSAMFTVKIGEEASEAFPWQSYGELTPVDVKESFDGDGITSGYGFRYPGSKPGALYVLQNGLLAFVWRGSRSVLTLHRLDLEEMLKEGERVPTLPPISNFAYLTKSYSNVFATGINISESYATSPDHHSFSSLHHPMKFIHH